MVKKPPSFASKVRSFFGLSEPNETGSLVVPPHPQAIGSPGTRSYSGYPNEEYLSTLQGRPRADLLDQMRRGDPQIAMLMNAVKNPIKAANWEVEPAGDSAEEVADAELIEHMLFNDMDQSFEEFISEALTLADFGFSIFEILDKPVVGHPEFGDYNGIASLSFRSQRTIERWNLDPATGRLKSVSQYAYGDLQRLVDIPAEFLLVLNVNKEGANYEGISLLRPCYGPWFRKNLYLKLNAIGIEKFAVPTPVVKVPDGKQNSEQDTYLKNALQQYTSHQANYLTIPEGWEVDLKTNTYDPQKVEVSIDNEDKRMTKSFLANFLELGMSGTGGAYSLSNDLSDFFLSGLDHLAHRVASPINRQLIPRMIQLNRGPRAKYPKLKASGISDKAGAELATILSSLTEKRILTPDDRLEDHMRERLGLPERSDQGVRLPQPPVQALPPGAGPPPAAPPPAPPADPKSLADRIRAAEAKRLAAVKRAEG